jgi:hypothetical protein
MLAWLPARLAMPTSTTYAKVGAFYIALPLGEYKRRVCKITFKIVRREP